MFIKVSNFPKLKKNHTFRKCIFVILAEVEKRRQGGREGARETGIEDGGGRKGGREFYCQLRSQK